MLYLIAEYLHFPGILNLIRYLSFRTGGAVATALVIGLLIGPKFIGWLRVRQGKGQPIRDDGPQSHLAKVGTPTMGGLMILTAVGISILLWMDLRNIYVWSCLLVMAGFGLVGFKDDYDKVKKRSHKGLSGRVRLLFEFLIAGATAVAVGTANFIDPSTSLRVADGIANASQRQQQAGVGQHVRDHDPLDVADGKTEGAGDGGKGDVDGRVELRHGRAHPDHGHLPRPGVEPAGGGEGRFALDRGHV